MQAVIICGGKGLRLKSITKNKPKALAKFNKIENLARQINMLKKNGVNNFLFLVNIIKNLLFVKIKTTLAQVALYIALKKDCTITF